MRTVDRHARAQVRHLGADAAAKQLTGLPAADLSRHLQIASDLLQGRTSSLKEARGWLYQAAERSGNTRAQVDAVIREVTAAGDGEAAARRYAQAVSGDARAAEQGLALARHYFKSDAQMTTEARLQDRDRFADQDTFRFEDRPEYRTSRTEAADGVRGALQRAMVSSGLSAPPPKTLEDARARAAAFGHAVADRIEARQREVADGKPLDIREHLSDAYDAQSALAAKHDVGLIGASSIGDVLEASDTQASYGASLAEGVA